MNKVVINYGGLSKLVAFFPGLDVTELNQLLQSIFGLSETVLGFESEDGLVIPLALACKEPSILPTNGLKLVIPKPKAATINHEPVQTPPNNASEQITSFTQPTSTPQIANAEDITKNSRLQELMKNIDALHQNHMLSNNDLQILKGLVAEDSILLDAAFSVTSSTKDVEYLSEILHDIAESIQTEEGKQACDAQDEVLQVAYKLKSQDDINDSQLLYICHLVLTRDEAVADIYDKFQENLDIDDFAQNLYDLVNNIKPEEAAISDNVPMEGLRSKLGGVVISMMTKGKISQAEASVLVDLVDEENDLVLDAFTAYNGYESSSDFEDYLLECVKAEIKRRLDELTDSKANSQSYQRDLVESITDSKSPATEASISNGKGAEDIPTKWKGHVPDLFVSMAFQTALKTDIWTTGDASTICDMFQNGNDLIRSAWEVYGVQQDHIDLIDTIRRIIRILKSSKQNKSPINSISVKAPTQESISASSTPTADPKSGSDDERKKKALAAVNAAKRELLKHSLEMMVKQGLLSAEASINLFKRALQGDALVDAAIEAYATDRNVSEFLDTLYILASHSEDDLKSMLDSVNENPESSNTNPIPEPQPRSAVSEAAKKYIQQVILEVVKQNIIPKESGAILLQLLTEDDEKLLGAFEVYAETQDLPDFIDSLIRIVHHKQSTSPSSVNQSQGDSKQTFKPSSRPASAISDAKSHISNSSAGKSPSRPSSIISSPSKDKRFDEELDIIGGSDESSSDEDDEDESDEDDNDDEGDNNDEDEVEGEREHLLDAEDQKNIIKILVSNQTSSITPVKQKALNSLIDSKSPEIQKIFTTYEIERDAHKLKDSLSDLVSDVEPSNAAAVKATTYDTPSKSTANTRAHNDEPVLSADDQKIIVDILLNSAAIDAKQHQYLCKLIDHKNRPLQQIFLLYEKERNVQKLLQSLKEVIEDGSNKEDITRSVSLSSDDTVSWNKGDDNQKVEDEEDDEPLEELDEDDRETIEQKFLSIIQSMNLDRLSSSALRLAIARGDDSIKRALEQYRQMKDDELLRKSLKEIAKQTIAEAEAEAEAENDFEKEEDDPDMVEDIEEDDDYEDMDDNDDEDDDEGDDEGDMDIEDIEEETQERKSNGYTLDADLYADFSKEDRDFLRSRGWTTKSSDDEEMKDGQNGMLNSTLYRNVPASHYGPSLSRDSTDEDDYNNKNNIDDDQPIRDISDSQSESSSSEESEKASSSPSKINSPSKTTGITSQAARAHVFPMLIKELTKEGIIDRNDGDILIREFQNNSAMVNAALDVYDLDSDMAELVDTLQRAAKVSST